MGALGANSDGSAGLIRAWHVWLLDLEAWLGLAFWLSCNEVDREMEKGTI
jgi:hypothetical protein